MEELSGQLDALEAEVADVERALARLDDGSYGTCEECGEPLAPALLDRQPAARRCPAHRLGAPGLGAPG